MYSTLSCTPQTNEWNITSLLTHNGMSLCFCVMADHRYIYIYIYLHASSLYAHVHLFAATWGRPLRWTLWTFCCLEPQQMRIVLIHTLKQQMCVCVCVPANTHAHTHTHAKFAVNLKSRSEWKALWNRCGARTHYSKTVLVMPTLVILHLIPRGFPSIHQI